MSLATRPLRVHLRGTSSFPLGGAKVTLQLSAYQADGPDIVPLVWTLIEDPLVLGDYVGDLWPNTRTQDGTHYDLLVQANDQKLLTHLVTLTEGETEAVLSLKINPPPYPPVYEAKTATESANTFANAAGTSATIAAQFAAGLGDVSEAVAATQEAAQQAANAEAQRLAYEDRVYPGVYSTPPTQKPHSGAPSADGDRCIILVSGVPTEHLRAGGGWLIPNFDAQQLAQAATLPMMAFSANEAQSIFDNALPMQDYTGLRAYGARAKSIRITGLYTSSIADGIAGNFKVNPLDTTSPDNGGTIIVDAAGRRWYRQFTGDVFVDWFGADRTGMVDCTSAVAAAASYLQSTRTGVGLGLGALVFGRGIYLCNGTVPLGEARGLTVRGQGFGATEIRRTIDTGVLFTKTLYSYLKFADLTINHTGVIANKASWTNTCWDLSGTNIGQNFILKRVRVHGFNKQIDFGSRVLNGDTNYASECYFSNFNTFLEAANNQGIINNFSKCSFFGTTGSAFKVSGFGHTHFDTCNIVMSGKFLELSGNGGPQSLYMVDNCKFEFYPQGGAIGTTQLVVMNNASSVKVLFRGGGLAGGAPDPSIYQIENRNSNGVIEFEGGNWAQSIKMRHYKQVATSVFGGQVFSTYTKFKNCTLSPSPANLVFDGTGGTNQSFPGAVWENCQDRPNLCVTGSANGQSVNAAVPADAVINRATFTGASIGGALLNGATPVTFAMPHHGQPAFLRAVRVMISSQDVVVSGTIKVFADAAKTNQIGSTLPIAGGASVVPKLYEFTVPADAVVTEGVYVEMKNSNGIYAYGRVYIETVSI